MRRCIENLNSVNDLWLTGGQLIVGNGPPAQQKRSLLIRGGRIAWIGSKKGEVQGMEVRVDRKTVMPGLINAHLQLWGLICLITHIGYRTERTQIRKGGSPA